MNTEVFIKYIKGLESAKARSFVEEILESGQNEAYLKALVRVIIHKAAEELNKIENSFYTDISELDEILFSTDENSAAYGAIDYLCKRWRQAALKDEKMLCEKAVSYIDFNYADQRLSASMLAKMLGITPSAFSVVFRKHSRMGFAEYVNRMRIEKSIELLNSDMPVAAVSKAVGYSCTESFIRAFKRYKSITPGTFRHL